MPDSKVLITPLPVRGKEARDIVPNEPNERGKQGIMVLVIPCLMNEWREGKGLSLPILELLYSPSEVGFRIRRWIRRGKGENTESTGAQID